MGREALWRFRRISANTCGANPCMVCLCAALVSFSFQGGAMEPSPVVQPTIAPLSPSKVVNTVGRGKRAATPALLDMVSQRELNQYMAFVVFHGQLSAK